MRRDDDFYPSVATLADAKNAARVGAAGALFVALTLAIAGTYVLVVGHTIDDQTPLSDGAKLAAALVGVILSVCSSIAAWRIATGKGFISATLMLIAYVALIIWAVLGGTANTTWFFIRLVIAFILLTGVRGTCAYRKITRSVTPGAPVS